MKRNEEIVVGENVSCSLFYFADGSGTCRIAEEMEPSLEPTLVGNTLRYVLVKKWAVFLLESPQSRLVSRLRKREFFDEGDYIG